jgi:hypothetical protein
MQSKQEVIEESLAELEDITSMNSFYDDETGYSIVNSEDWLLLS